MTLWKNKILRFFPNLKPCSSCKCKIVTIKYEPPQSVLLFCLKSFHNIIASKKVQFNTITGYLECVFLNNSVYVMIQFHLCSEMRTILLNDFRCSLQPLIPLIRLKVQNLCQLIVDNCLLSPDGLTL